MGSANTVGELRRVFGGAPDVAGVHDQSNVLGVVGFDDDLTTFGKFLKNMINLYQNVLPSSDHGLFHYTYFLAGPGVNRRNKNGVLSPALPAGPKRHQEWFLITENSPATHQQERNFEDQKMAWGLLSTQLLFHPNNGYPSRQDWRYNSIFSDWQIGPFANNIDYVGLLAQIEVFRFLISIFDQLLALRFIISFSSFTVPAL